MESMLTSGYLDGELDLGDFQKSEVSESSGNEGIGIRTWKECTKRQAKMEDSKEWTASIPNRVNSERV